MDMPLGLDIREGKYCRWKTHINLLVFSSYNLPKSNYKEVQTFAADPETLQHPCHPNFFFSPLEGGHKIHIQTPSSVQPSIFVLIKPQEESFHALHLLDIYF